jgi:hypothetical protein
MQAGRVTTEGSATTGQTIEAAWRRRKIALVAHDRRKRDLQEWARFNRGVLARRCRAAIRRA